MEEENINKEEFSLTPVLNPETKEYSIKGFEEVKSACARFIEENKVTSCANDDDYRILKKSRTALRKKAEEIKNTRVALTRVFTSQFLTLEKMLNSADDEMKKIKDEFDALKPKEEVVAKTDQDEKSITLVINYRDDSVISEIKKLATGKGCTVTEIKEKK